MDTSSADTGYGAHGQGQADGVHELRYPLVQFLLIRDDLVDYDRFGDQLGYRFPGVQR